VVIRLRRRTSRSANWSIRIIKFILPVFLFTGLFHRFGLLDTISAMALFAFVWMGAVIALILGVVSILGIWRLGLDGARSALWGMIFAVAMLTVPLYFSYLAVTLPRINDISTQLRDPISFMRIAGVRPADALAIVSDYGEAAELRRSAYPHIRPLFVGTSAEDTFLAAELVAEDLDWDIVASEPPPDSDQSGRFQAVDTTLVLGFKDDVMVVVSPDAGGSRVDVRSVSRYGRHDFGQNANRITEFLIALREEISPSLGQ